MHLFLWCDLPSTQKRCFRSPKTELFENGLQWCSLDGRKRRFSRTEEVFRFKFMFHISVDGKIFEDDAKTIMWTENILSVFVRANTPFSNLSGSMDGAKINFVGE